MSPGTAILPPQLHVNGYINQMMVMMDACASLNKIRVCSTASSGRLTWMRARAMSHDSCCYKLMYKEWCACLEI
jgi:hypothetical protein